MLPVVALAVTACSASPTSGTSAPPTGAARLVVRSTPTVVTAASAAKPLAGRVVVIDPGHNLGNSRHAAQIGRLVNAGGSRKPCNTTGTATASGYPEATFAWSVATYLKARLVAQGATVYLTRSSNSASAWGPCVDVRGRFGNTVHADAVVSVHADGTASRFHGFFAIRPARKQGWTDDIYTGSGRLALDVRAGLQAAGLPRANYNGGDGLDTRGDLGTLNWSNVPTVMVELGNMKNATDAAHMRSASWRDSVYAAGLARGLATFLRR
ncbi:N-acetylmuramoyl-L-alanine amidase [Angustibacter sp. McL0619]|uniref:N-acetylmuramoyl-L-alanine amidase n=1 Tax=Angustibacter sp. McL0619 TaxID=3415676 RepID=UPI003CEFF2CF